MIQSDENNSVALILKFLKNLANHNDRTWFQANRAQYEEAKETFEALTSELIHKVSLFDDSVKYLSPKDCLYRIYRDIRFSEDKSPYKRHMGCYLNARGKKSLHGGYYFHLQPGENMVAGGCWCLPTNILNSVRQTIVYREKDFEEIVSKQSFKELFPTITFEPLKVMPRGMPKNFGHPEYVKCRNYCVSHTLSDDFFNRQDWMTEITHQFQVMKPFLDFVNDVVDDYI